VIIQHAFDNGNTQNLPPQRTQSYAEEDNKKISKVEPLAKVWAAKVMVKSENPDKGLETMNSLIEYPHSKLFIFTLLCVPLR